MLRLRPFENRDAEVITGWIKDEVAFRQWSADRYDRFPLEPEDIIRQYVGADEAALFPITAVDGDTVVGHMIMRYPNKDRSILRFGFIIVDDAKRGKGYGKQMLHLAIQHAFDILDVDKITLGVFENNPAAYHCYKAAGFRDVEMEEAEYYSIMGQQWKCLEMELVRGWN